MAFVVGRVFYKLLPYIFGLVVLLFWSGSLLKTPLELQNAVDVPVDPLYLLRELQLRQVIEACSARRNTVIHIDIKSQRVTVADEFNHTDDCPVMDIALRTEERGVGFCTDVALYVVYAQARVIPLLPPERMQQYDQRCLKATPRVFFETMYPDWFSREPGGFSIMQVNHEHMWVNDLKFHNRINIFLAKTRVAHHLLQQYVSSANLQSQVVYVGHSSSDPAVIFPPGASSDLLSDPHQLAAQGRMSSLPDYERFVHIKGKSGLKHTDQLLECWGRNPAWPVLTMVGYLEYTRSSTKEFLSKPNLNIKPTPTEKREFDPIGFEDLRQLMASSGVHICPSEREGFGHYINEARASSAMTISTDHPPMNELVIANVTGLLIKPSRTGSYSEMVLGNYSHIIAFLSADDICDGVQKAMLTPLEQRRMLGMAARQAYLEDRRGFVARVTALTAQLAKLV